MKKEIRLLFKKLNQIDQNHQQKVRDLKGEITEKIEAKAQEALDRIDELNRENETQINTLVRTTQRSLNTLKRHIRTKFEILERNDNQRINHIEREVNSLKDQALINSSDLSKNRKFSTYLYFITSVFLFFFLYNLNSYYEVILVILVIVYWVGLFLKLNSTMKLLILGMPILIVYLFLYLILFEPEFGFISTKITENEISQSEDPYKVSKVLKCVIRTPMAFIINEKGSSMAILGYLDNASNTDSLKTDSLSIICLNIEELVSLNKSIPIEPNPKLWAPTFLLGVGFLISILLHLKPINFIFGQNSRNKKLAKEIQSIVYLLPFFFWSFL